MTTTLCSRNLSAAQCLCFKYALEAECGLGVGFLGLLFLNFSLVFRTHWFPNRLMEHFPPPKRSLLKRLELFHLLKSIQPHGLTGKMHN